MSKVIILNAPPKGGKDSLCSYFLSCLPYSGNPMWVEHMSFATPLKQINQIIYNLTDEEVKELNFNHELKDLKQDRFGGKSWRECLIDTSTDLKAQHGLDYFGVNLVQRIDRMNHMGLLPNIIITDGGFDEEQVPLVERFGRENYHVIKIIREGFDYSSDSRKYIDCEKLGVEPHILHNRGTLDQYMEDGYNLITEILGA